MMVFDTVIVLVILISALAGFIRGGTREIVTLVAFTLSILTALLLLPLTGPFFRKLVNPDWLGTVAAAAVVFLIAYLAIHAFGAWLRDRLSRAERLGGLDRMVGFGFGVVRALVLIGAFHLVFHSVTPPQRLPGWFANAKLYRVSAACAKGIQVVLPAGARVADSVAPRVERSVREGATDRPQSSDNRAAAYNGRQRADMDALVETSR